MNHLREAAKQQTASLYLTIVSIIQSFALGFLLSWVKDAVEKSTLWPLNAQALCTWLQVIAVFQLIVMTWHVNVNNAVIFKLVFYQSESAKLLILRVTGILGRFIFAARFTKPA